MVTLLRVVVSFVFAADAIAVFFWFTDGGDIGLAPFVLLVTGSITLFIAGPLYLTLRLYRRETWLSCIVAGFLVGAVVVACVLIPASGSLQIGQEMMVDAGVRTTAGWRTYAETVGIAGAIGASAGAVFWATLRLLERGGRWPRLRLLPLTGSISLAIAASWTILAIPGLIMDRSCHNVSRDGRQSIAPVLFFTVELTGGEWLPFQDVAKRFASAEGWDVHTSNDKDEALSYSRFISVCIEPGTEIKFDGADMPELTRAGVLVFRPPGGNSWQAPAERLLASIESSFPGRLRRDFTGTEAQTPSTLLPQPR